jgi:hypothetical protein
MKLKKSTLIKTVLFGVVGSFAIVTLIVMLNDGQPSDEFKSSRILAYTKLGYAVERLMDTSNSDSLSSYATEFNRVFVGRDAVLADDRVLALPIMRFKYELNDKLSGAINLLDPDRFDRSGREIMRLCQDQIVKISGTKAEHLISFYKH